MCVKGLSTGNLLLKLNVLYEHTLCIVNAIVEVRRGGQIFIKMVPSWKGMSVVIEAVHYLYLSFVLCQRFFSMFEMEKRCDRP